MDTRPIGVFDSGLGGLTVVKKLREVLPHEDIVYFGDTGRVPYGTKGRETILRYARQDMQLLLNHDVKLIVAACGTVSSFVTEELTRRLPVPFLSVLAPAAQKAAALSSTGRIGVLGTSATVHSKSYGKAIRGIRADAVVLGKACPMFVPLAENGYIHGHPMALPFAQEYLESLKKEDLDVVILGCTHYPLLFETIHQVLGDSCRYVDTGAEAALSAQAYLTLHSLRKESEEPGRLTLMVSDLTDSFADTAALFLGEPVEEKEIQVVSADAL